MVAIASANALKCFLVIVQSPNFSQGFTPLLYHILCFCQIFFVRQTRTVTSPSLTISHDSQITYVGLDHPYGCEKSPLGRRDGERDLCPARGYLGGYSSRSLLSIHSSQTISPYSIAMPPIPCGPTPTALTTGTIFSQRSQATLISQSSLILLIALAT